MQHHQASNQQTRIIMQAIIMQAIIKLAIIKQVIIMQPVITLANSMQAMIMHCLK
jgi:hypothetical protein